MRCSTKAPWGQQRSRPRAYRWRFRQLDLQTLIGWRGKYCFRRSSFSLRLRVFPIVKGQLGVAEGNSIAVAATGCGVHLGYHLLTRRWHLGRPFICYCHIIASHLDDVDFVVDSENCYVGFYPSCGRLCLVLYLPLCFHLYLCCYICFPWDLHPSSRLGNSDSITLIAFLVLGTTSCFGS